MRTALLILGTLALMVGGFFVYWTMQPANTGQPTTQAAAARRAAQPLKGGESSQTLQGGEGVWVKEFDKSAKLVNQFRVAEFDPQKEGFVRVKKPEAHFFLKGGQYIRLLGETGEVVRRGGGDAFASPGGMGTPSRGRLQDVRIQLYDSLDATTPSLDMAMNNAAFDNEAFRIYTEGYTDASGKQIAAEDVKVTVRGDYEFDGRGLTIRWNDLDRRLEHLEIAKGERLVVKKPGLFGSKSFGKPDKEKASAPAAASVAKPAADSPAPPAVAAAPGQQAATQTPAATTSPATSRPAGSTLYSIWFYDNVQIVQADKTLASGSVMEIFHAMNNSAEPGKAAPAAVPAAPGDAQPAAKPQATAESAPEAAPAVPAEAQTKPVEEAEQPIFLYWTGKLRIVPSTTEPPVPVKAGESVVQIRGTPVRLEHDNVLIRTASLAYRTSDSGAMLSSSNAFPQVEIDQYATIERIGNPKLSLRSERVEYDPKANQAKMSGKSRAVFPSDRTNKSAVPAQASWTREGVAKFSGEGDSIVIESLALSGDVDVQHSQILLQTQRLALAFDPPPPAKVDPKTGEKQSAEPLVRGISADDSVHCILLGDDGVETELFSDHLDLATALDSAGELYPKIVNASGNVRAKQQGRQLGAGELAMSLAPPAPSTRPAAPIAADGKPKLPPLQLVRMDAKTNVRVTTEDGAIASGETLTALPGPDGKPQMELNGKPARVTNKVGTVVASPTIKVISSTEARMIGPGSLHAIAKGDDPNAKPREMDVTWTDSAIANFKLKENQVQLVGTVNVKMPEQKPEGMELTTARADRIFITLVDLPPAPVPAAAAARKPAKSAAAPEKEGVLASADVDVMKGKQVSRILLDKAVVVDSTLTAPANTLLRQMHIESSLLAYDVRTRNLNVPRPGRMLVRDHSPREEKDDKEAGEKDGLSSERGASAFSWKQELVYSGAEQRARLVGDVVVTYQPDDPSEPRVRLDAKRVDASFEEKKRDPAAPRKTNGFEPPPIQLRSLRATGDVSVNRDGDVLTTPILTYDPLSNVIRALGDDQASAEFTAKGTGGKQSADAFQWNTKTWKMRAERVQGRAAAPPR